MGLFKNLGILTSLTCLGFISQARAADVDACAIGNNRAALVSGIAQVAGTSNILAIKCIQTLQVGTDPTQIIFIPANTHIRFDAGGSWATNNIQTPTFVVVNANNVTLDNLTMTYNAPYGSTNTDLSQSISNQANDTVIKNYMKSQGVAFASGVNPVYDGPTNLSALINIRGSSTNFRIRGCTVTATGTNASTFIPVFVAFTGDYYGTAGALAVPTNTNISNCTLDGTYMGFTGHAKGTVIENIHSLRYSVMQAPDGSNQRGTPTNTWFSPPHLFYLRSGSGIDHSAAILNVIDDGPYVGNPLRGDGGGTLVSLKVEVNGILVRNYTSHRPDGVADLIAEGFTSNGHISNLNGEFNSSIKGADGSSNFGVRWPGVTLYTNLTMDNIIITDDNTAPTTSAFLGANSSSNSNISITNLVVYTRYTGGGPDFGGTNVSIQGTFNIIGCTTPPTTAILKNILDVKNSVVVKCI